MLYLNSSTMRDVMLKSNMLKMKLKSTDLKKMAESYGHLTVHNIDILLIISQLKTRYMEMVLKLQLCL